MKFWPSHGLKRTKPFLFSHLWPCHIININYKGKRLYVYMFVTKHQAKNRTDLPENSSEDILNAELTKRLFLYTSYPAFVHAGSVKTEFHSEGVAGKS